MQSDDLPQAYGRRRNPELLAWNPKPAPWRCRYPGCSEHGESVNRGVKYCEAHAAIRHAERQRLYNARRKFNRGDKCQISRYLALPCEQCGAAVENSHLRRIDGKVISLCQACCGCEGAQRG